MERVSRRPEVRRDLVEIADYVSHDNLGAALRLLDAAEETFKFLADNREAGQLLPFSPEAASAMRVWPMKGFRNYLVFYQPNEDGVEIVRVLHGARDIEALFNE